MKNQLIIYFLLVSLVASQTYSITPCKCEELMSEGDCSKQITLQCQWDSTQKACYNQINPVTPAITFASYCDNFSESDCPKSKPCTNCGSYGACAWIEKKCKFFTGCTAFAKTTDSECQAISNKCITDGIHCVEIDDCSTYKKQQTCIKNALGNYCFWDKINNTCLDANTCDKLPISFTTDKNCRDAISTCTTKNGGGCIDSGNNCSDQTLEIQCFWDKQKINSCFWNGAVCKDRICENALSNLITDEACKQFRTDGTCTTKVNGGCVTRTSCSAANISAACIKNSSGDECYWTGTACVDKICSNAPVTMTTNLACSGFVSGCITKLGGGCITNGVCSVANIQAACVKNSLGFDCIWDTTCKEKTCPNAPTSNNTHELCSIYLQTCTVKSGGGCVDRTCLNAPITLNTNDACETYLPGQKCITKNGGGCLVNTSCAVITYENACIKNSSGQPCFWHSTSSSCKDKICTNAPSTNTSHDLCQQFLSNCTVNKTNTGCVEKTCENSLVSTICDKDASNRECIWKGKCYKKQCILASQSITSHADCQTYHPTCTLSNTGFGCVLLPLKCEVIKIQAACYIRNNGQKCGWNGSSCIDKNCSTASKILTTTSECQNHLPTCVASNPVNGSIQGCQDLPTTCTARKSIQNCEIARNGFPTCLWVPSTTTCVEKTCATANTAGTTGALSSGGFSFTACSNYLSVCTATNASGICTNTIKPCISNNNQDGCINKSSSCTGLNSQNCQLESKQNGDCYWNGSSCVDRTCGNLQVTPFSHDNCKSAFNQCTVNNQGNACQVLATACISYTTQENCKIIIANKRCIWTGSLCRNATCNDALDTTDYDSFEECKDFLTPNETCTVVPQVGGKGCVLKQANCNDYGAQSQCHKTISNLTAIDDCKWIVDKCYALSTFATGACSTFKGTQVMCQGYRQGCTNVALATSSSSCTLDCTLKTGSGLSFQDCQAVDLTCSVKFDGSACITIQSTCTGYTLNENCYRSGVGLCFWNGSGCSVVIQASDCVQITGLTGLDHSKCQTYHNSCTSLENGTGCQEYKASCSGYLNQNSCTISAQGKCFYDGSNCIRFALCSQIQSNSYTDYACSSYNSACISNTSNTSCIGKKKSCKEYSTKINCRSQLDSALCFWNGTECNLLTNAQTQCAYFIGDNLNCSTYHSDCIYNRRFTACQYKQANCSDYSEQDSCSESKANKCIWKNSSCQNFSDPQTDCSYFCGQYSTSCIVKSDLTGCYGKKSTCEDYGNDKQICLITTSNTQCVWNGSSCVAFVDAATSCHLKTGTNLEIYPCVQLNNGCTVNKSRTACTPAPSSCSSAVEENCTGYDNGGTQQFCAWIDSTCKDLAGEEEGCSTINQSNHSLIFDTTCKQFHQNCTSNKDKTSCQARLATCDLYLTENNCTFSQASGYQRNCFWTGTTCISIQNANQCAYINGINFQSFYCEQTFNGCTANKYETACQELKSTCGDYVNESNCSESQSITEKYCVWTGTVCKPLSDPQTECILRKGTLITDYVCFQMNKNCTNLVDYTGCQFWQENCKDYDSQNKCKNTSKNKLCVWLDNACQQVVNGSCEEIKGTGLDHVKCQAYNQMCTSQSDGSSCQDYAQKCEVYPGTALACTKSLAGKCYLQNANTCITILNATTDCAKITGGAGTITYEICQSYNLGCSVNRARSACIQQQAQCQDYNSSMGNCYKSAAGLCIGSTISDTACVAISNATTCDAVVLGTGNYSDANCNMFKAGCSSNGTACVGKAQNCSDLTVATCVRSIEGECIVSGTTCIKKTCDTALADSTYDDDTKCSNYLQQCTVARIGSCQARITCNLYKSQIQCKFNQSGQQCFWNPSIKTCVDLKCENIEATTLYNSHNKCVIVDATLACTVKALNGAAVPGCISRGSCNSYAIQEQCKTNSNGGECVWNTNQTQPICLDKSCSSAPNTITTHNNCLIYYNTQTVKCTVFATPNNAGGEATLGGCQQVASCSSYIHKEQCQINANGDPCGWNGTQCADKSCLTAPVSSDYDDNTKCRAYFNNLCTVAENGQGCIEIPIACETMIEKQCYYNKAGDQCYWTGTACVTRNCENAPETITTADECNTYLAGCTLDDVKCKTKICEDFQFQTDAQCRQAQQSCTTNGTLCVTRGTCIEALNKAGCVTSSNNEQCEWIPAILNAQNQVTTEAYCTIKGCNTAPLTLTSETACAEYFPNCTTKNGGGCIIKSTCSAANIQEACTKALNGTNCAWDSSQNKCREKDCQDFNGTTHTACQTQKNGCTAGTNGKCAKVQNCQQTTIRAACIEGIDGPCLWIDKYPNDDGTLGACFQYTSCKSLIWDTDEKCKLISNQCTTNGINCIGINQCSETNTNGGCITGYDGLCIQSVPSLNSQESKICKLYTSCADAFYITHSDCQIANKKCTTNGTTGCISLAQCSSYTQKAGCVINDKGVEYTSGAITSTGNCVWDLTTSICKDQSCVDLIGINHTTCASQLSTCTSDGLKCLLKGTCQSYTSQTACTTALGSDGVCYWEIASATNTTPKCRIFTCADIKNGTSTNVCSVALSSCISNGTNCIPKANCSTYTNKTACYSGGLDGICVFTQSTATGATPDTGICQLMTECSTANKDQTACQAAKDRCSWITTTGTNTTTNTSCTAHTCATNQVTNGACTKFLNWDKKTQQFCTMLNNKCTSIDPQTLTNNECFQVTGYTYSWNSQTNTCSVCFKDVIQPNSSINNTINQTNNQTTAYEQILHLSTIIMAYLIF